MDSIVIPFFSVTMCFCPFTTHYRCCHLLFWDCLLSTDALSTILWYNIIICNNFHGKTHLHSGFASVLLDDHYKRCNKKFLSIVLDKLHMLTLLCIIFDSKVIYCDWDFFCFPSLYLLLNYPSFIFHNSSDYLQFRLYKYGFEFWAISTSTKSLKPQKRGLKETSWDS